jgi:hypothetical protein
VRREEFTLRKGGQTIRVAVETEGAARPGDFEDAPNPDSVGSNDDAKPSTKL